MDGQFSKCFNGAGTREIAAERVYGSEEFIEVARTALRESVIKRDREWACLWPHDLGGLYPKEGDEKYLQAAFKALRQEFPSLHEIRYDEACYNEESQRQAPAILLDASPLSPPKKSN